MYTNPFSSPTFRISSLKFFLTQRVPITLCDLELDTGKDITARIFECRKNPFYLRLPQDSSKLSSFCQISYSAFSAQSKHPLYPDPSYEPYQAISGNLDFCDKGVCLSSLSEESAIRRTLSDLHVHLPSSQPVEGPASTSFDPRVVCCVERGICGIDCFERMQNSPVEYRSLEPYCELRGVEYTSPQELSSVEVRNSREVSMCNPAKSPPLRILFCEDKVKGWTWNCDRILQWNFYYLFFIYR